MKQLPLVAIAFLLLAPRAAAQFPADLSAERAAFAEWLDHAPTSPRAAVSATAIDAAGAVVALPGGKTARVIERGAAFQVIGDGNPHGLAHDRAGRIGPYVALVRGEPGNATLLLFGEHTPGTGPAYYPYDPKLVFIGTLDPPAAARQARILTADGADIVASEAGTVTIDVSGVVRLTVMRIPDPASEESSLEIYFRDATNGGGSYPAGRFVTLDPVGAGRYRLDFNRARNPFCAYSAFYQCPAPWRGNTIGAAVAAGERYESGR